jgi:hypothetical protein
MILWAMFTSKACGMASTPLMRHAQPSVVRSLNGTGVESTFSFGVPAWRHVASNVTEPSPTQKLLLRRLQSPHIAIDINGMLAFLPPCDWASPSVPTACHNGTSYHTRKWQCPGTVVDTLIMLRKHMVFDV